MQVGRLLPSLSSGIATRANGQWCSILRLDPSHDTFFDPPFDGSFLFYLITLVFVFFSLIWLIMQIGVLTISIFPA